MSMRKATYDGITRVLDTKLRTEGGITLKLTQLAESVEIDRFHPAYGYQVGIGSLVEEEYFDVTEAHIALIKEQVDSESYIGLWLDNGNLYIDESICMVNLRYALEVAKENNEIAIYDWENSCEILVPYPDGQVMDA